MTKNGKILFVSEYAGFFGGIEQYVFNTARELRNAGFSVSLLYEKRCAGFEDFAGVFVGTFDTIPDKPEEYSGAVIHKSSNNRLIAGLLETFGSQLAAVVHDHDLYCPRKYYYTPFGRKNCSRAYSWPVCSLCGTAVSPRQFKPGIVSGWCDRVFAFPRRLALYRRISRIAVLSDFMRGNLLRNGFRSEAVRVIHPPIKLPPAGIKTPESARTVCFVGQLIRGKGADSLLEMLALLKTPGVRAVIAGDGNERASLEVRARELGVRAEFVGRCADVAGIFSRAAVAVLPFRWQEPFGLTGIEAAAAGVPVIAFDTGGVREWLRDGITGFAVPAGDTARLAECCDRLLASPETAAKMGAAGRRLAEEEFSSERFVQSFSEFLK